MPATNTDQPNVLLLSIHDLNVHLGCFGNAVVQSPNLDGLAGRGRLFANHFCQYPLCGPSRASLLTGRRPDTTRVLDNREWFRHTLPEVVTLPAHFKAHGYWTAKQGTVFHGGLDDADAWDVGYEPYAPRPNRTPEQQLAREARADRFEPSDEADETFAEVKTAEWAVEMLEQKREGPFFLAAGFSKPHVPLIAPRRFFDLYNPADVVVPPRSEDSEKRLPAPARRPNFDIFIRREAADEAEARRAMVAYYACISFMDEQIGKILDAVDRLGLRENTVIVLFSDHGFHLGEFGFWSKMTLFDASVRVPCIVAAPGVSQTGTPTHRLTEHVDLYPTLVDLCGLPIPEGLEGTSLRPLLRDPDRSWKRAAFSQIRRSDVHGRMARTEEWHYNRWDGADEELYHLAADPWQLNNLAKQPESATVLQEMRDILKGGWSGARPVL